MNPSSLRFFTPGEAATLEAWTETLIPTDQDPGARTAGVVNYIDRQLMRKFRKDKPAYREAIANIELAARQLTARAFTELDLDAQTSLLKMMEDGKAPGNAFPDGGKAAFEMVLTHTLQGYYGSPRHGGNRDYASWRMVGVPPMPVRGRQHYEVAQTYPEKS